MWGWGFFYWEWGWGQWEIGNEGMVYGVRWL